MKRQKLSHEFGYIIGMASAIRSLADNLVFLATAKDEKSFRHTALLMARLAGEVGLYASTVHDWFPWKDFRENVTAVVEEADSGRSSNLEHRAEEILKTICTIELRYRRLSEEYIDVGDRV